jgi:hypothetical protein
MTGAQVAVWRVGERVTCPRCGRRGVVAIERIAAKGHHYWYAVIRHYEPPEYKVEKCYIRRVEGPSETVEGPPAAAMPAAKPKPREPIETRAEAPPPVVDVEEIRNIVREEVRALERALNAVMSEIASKMIEKEEIEEVVIDGDTYNVLQKVFRSNCETSQEEKQKAYQVWDKVFAAGRKIVDVRR